MTELNVIVDDDVYVPLESDFEEIVSGQATVNEDGVLFVRFRSEDEPSPVLFGSLPDRALRALNNGAQLHLIEGGEGE